MAVISLTDSVRFVGVRDWNLKMFDKLIPTPLGTSYNSYVVKGNEKTVLIDGVEERFTDELFTNLQNAGVEKIDYIIVNHAEQDHTGALPALLGRFPEARIVTNKKCKMFLNDLLGLEDEIMDIIGNDETLDLGGLTLRFVMTPWVHWPETMCTYLEEEKVLFSCDFFGSHLAQSELLSTDQAVTETEARRYYAQIMMPFKKHIVKNIEKVEQLELDYIAPSHGPVYDNPDTIIALYKEWVSEAVTNTVLIPYVSMHGSTEKMVAFLADALIRRNIKVRLYDLSDVDYGNLCMDALDAATIVFGTSNMLSGPHPHVAFALTLLNGLSPKTKFVTAVGSYGWSGKLEDSITENLKNLNAEFLNPIFIKGYPKEDSLTELEELADEIERKHKELGIA